MISRRKFLETTILAGGSLLVQQDSLARLLYHLSKPYPEGKIVGVVPFCREAVLPFGRLLDSGLDGRLYTDLSKLSANALITPVQDFYVRTSASDLLDVNQPWRIKVKAADQVRVMPIEKIRAMSTNLGAHLMECSGNSGGGFGMLSACEWTGVPLLRALKSIGVEPEHKRVCVSGFDSYSRPSGVPGLNPSIPGASWIFSVEQLASTGAFLATEMNGHPLPKDHGYPVRLFVPGWYGCTCIKWVTEISLLDDDAPATSQMREFAERTHQIGIPALAKDYQPASIDQAAMPVRVEQWQVGEHSRYNVVGIMWGGNRPTRDLQIRFLPDETYLPVHEYHQTTNTTWTLWSYKWEPTKPGVYSIQMHVNDPTIRTRRLDSGYYTRSVEISSI